MNHLGRFAYKSPSVLRIADIADAIESGLQRRLAQFEAEQSVYGLDSLDEVALHPLIAVALEEAGYGVHREQRYPADRKHRRISEGERCDFVLTPDGCPLKHPDAAATLFEPPESIDLCDAFWLEAKVIAQFNQEGANRNYASQLLATVRHDVTKLAKDDGILHAGLLILMFVRDQVVAEHDLGIWENRCIKRGLPIAAPSRRFIPINDRCGNGMCAISLYPVSHL
jgi:hypothetical protein